MQSEIHELYSLKNVAYTTVRNKILNCEIMPGERIREDLIAEEINISRTPVREAMNRLVMEGLITNVPRKGLYCMEITAKTIDDVCEVRKMVDLYAFRGCCGKLDDSQVKNLLQMAEQMECGNIVEDTHIKFHTYFIKLTGNPLLMRVENMYDTYLKYMFALSNYSMMQCKSENNNFEHKLMVELLRDDRLSEAETVCVHHVDKLRADLYAYLKQRNIFNI